MSKYNPSTPDQIDQRNAIFRRQIDAAVDAGMVVVVAYEGSDEIVSVHLYATHGFAGEFHKVHRDLRYEKIYRPQA